MLYSLNNDLEESGSEGSRVNLNWDTDFSDDDVA
jgi:hypothetical protein